MKKGWLLAGLLLAGPAAPLTYTGDAFQFAGGFNPASASYGGFGGGSCTAVRTPIVFLHGNGDEAKNWDSTVAIHGLDYGGLWGSVRKFISISGALRGLSSCWWMGYANPVAPTCGSQNVFDSNIFGFFPNLYPAYNPRMGDGGYRDRPSGKSAQFYSIRAGYNDQIACSTVSYYAGCGDTSKFDAYTNVKAQLNVGRGSTAAQYDYDFSDWTIYNTGGGVSGGASSREIACFLPDLKSFRLSHHLLCRGRAVSWNTSSPVRAWSASLPGPPPVKRGGPSRSTC